jgi:hypothetical protein
MRFFPCLELRETLGNKGFRKLSILFDKKSFKLLANFVGNLVGVGHVAGMSDSFDTIQTACASPNSVREFIKCGRETYKLHSIHESGVPIYRRVYDGECNRGGGSQWRAKSVSYKSLASARANLDFFELNIA